MDALLSPRRRQLLAAFGAAALGSACGWRGEPRALRLAGTAMGSTWSARLVGAPFDSAFERRALEAVTGAIDAVVGRMSTFDPASELSRFNAHAATTPFALSADTLAVLARAQGVAAASGGAFDVTVAPLVGAWGFGAGAAARGAPPPPSELGVPLGWRGIVLDAREGTVRKEHPALRLDLSGVAKGYAVDQAALALEALGVERYMVEAGGEIRTRGLNAESRPWQIAIERPDAWPQQVHRIVPLAGLSIATSGDYRNFYLAADGRRIHHEIDPDTRAPAVHALASVSVVHARCTDADAWATALFVRGPERGLALAREQGLAALFIVREAGGYRDLASPAFDALLD